MDFPPMIDKNKQYRTRDGREVRIYATDGGMRPVHGAWKNVEGLWIMESWHGCGSLRQGGCNSMDLIEVKPRIKREVWMNVYPSGANGGYATKETANSSACYDRIACVRLTIDCEEGEGL